MCPGPVPPLPPKRGSPPSTGIVDTGPKADNNLLAAIQKGTKLKKPTTINDRSAPKLGGASCTIPVQAADNATSQISACKPQGLFSNGFPQLKKAPPRCNEQKEEARTGFTTTSSASSRPVVVPSQEKLVFDKEPAVIPVRQGELPKSKPIPIPPQRLDCSDLRWNFNSRFLPSVVPRQTAPTLKKYPSGAKEGLNQYCKDAVQLESITSSKRDNIDSLKRVDTGPAKIKDTGSLKLEEMVQSTRQKLRASLRQAVEEEQFELCVEIKRYMKELEAPNESNNVSQLVFEIKERLNI